MDAETDNDYDTWDASEHMRPAPARPPARKANPTPSAPPPSAGQAAPAHPGRRAAKAAPSGRPVPHGRHLRNFPGFIARSAMFRACSSNAPFEQATEVKVQGDCKLTLSGPMLTMRDKHVWETAIQLAKLRAPSVSDAFEIELRDFDRRMREGMAAPGDEADKDREPNGRALASIWSSLKRLALCRVEFEINGSCRGVGSLLATAYKESGRLYLRLNPDCAVPFLLGDKQFALNQARRAALPSALAQWLHDFLSTHKVAKSMDLLYLRELCGYGGPGKNFPGKLQRAMEALAVAAPGLVASFNIEKLGRNSDAWELAVVRGAEKPSYLKAESVPAAAPTGRGGVSL